MGRGYRRPVSRVRKVPGHSEVNQENETALKPNNQILAATIHRCDALPGQLCSHLCRIDGTRQPGIEDLNVFEPAAEQFWLEVRSDRLDFGQLRHRVRSLAPEIRPAEAPLDVHENRSGS